MKSTPKTLAPALTCAVALVASSRDASSALAFAPAVRIRTRPSSSTPLPSPYAPLGGLPGSGTYENHIAPAATASPSPIQSQSQSRSSPPSTTPSDLGRRNELFLWTALATGLAVASARSRPFPLLVLTALTRPQWAFVHALSSALFVGTIFFPALMEQLIVSRGDGAALKSWFHADPPRRFRARRSWPALAMAIFSGAGRATWEYGGLGKAPGCLKGALHGLLAFGLWWGVADATHQQKVAEAVRGLSDEECGADAVEVPGMLKRRAIGNVASCLLVWALYDMMVLKPGFGI